MSLRTFFDNFPLVTDAPNGTTKLRELILQMAVEGMLVPQYSVDGSAIELLQRIKSAKEGLIKQGKKKVAPVSVIKESEIPYSIPEAWIWTSLESVGLINPRNEFEDDEIASFVPMNLVPRKYGDEVKTDKRLWKEIKNFTHFAEGDVVIAKITPCFQNGKAAVMRGLESGIGAGTTELHVFRPLGQTIYSEYVLVYLKSRNFVLEGIPRMTGSAGQKRVPSDYFARNPFPLPPFEEQKRIVAKVDELMRLCDELEEKHQARRVSRMRLNNAALAPLNSAASLPSEEFEQACISVADNFTVLFDSVDTVGRLRSTVLQLAVQGKLVRQDSDDEPASELLKRIRSKKSKGKNGRNESGDANLASPPFDLPAGWKWCHLYDLGITQTGTTPATAKAEYYGSDYPFVKPADIMNGGINYRGAGLSELGLEVGKLVPANSVLMVSIGGSIGKVGIVDRDCSCNQQINYVTLHIGVVPKVIYYYLKSPYFQEQVLSRAPQTTLPILSKGKWDVIPLPLPPSEEQKRIVAKVDQLMTLCDELESQLRRAEAESEKLMNAAVPHLLTSVNQRSVEALAGIVSMTL